MTVRREIRTDAGFEIGFAAGLNEQDVYSINILEASDGYNFILDREGTRMRRRATQDYIDQSPNAGEITSIMQLIKRDDSQTHVVVSGDTVYDWNGATVWTDITPPVFTSGTGGARLRGAPWLLDEVLVISDIDLENPIFEWDGTDLTQCPTELVIGSPVSVTTLTRVGSTATAVTASPHSYTTQDLVSTYGADQTDYNVQREITVVDSITYTYPVEEAPTTPATGSIFSDKGSVVKAKYVVVYQNRVWLFNLEIDGTAFPHMCLASDFEDYRNYDNSKRAGDSSFSTGNEAFFMYAPDLKPINGKPVEFYDRLIISTADGKLFALTGSDSTDYAWVDFYSGSSAVGDESIVNVGNDLMYFRKGKAIESLVSTDRYGDVATDDLSWWIPTSVALMENPLAVYDQSTQLVYFFDDAVDGVMVFDKTFHNSSRAAEERLSPWSRYTTAMDNNFETKVATQLRKFDEVTYSVYWGCVDGIIYDINGTGETGDGDPGLNGGGVAIDVQRKTRIITELNTNDELMVGRLEYTRNFEVDIDLIFSWLDELNNTPLTLTLKEPAEFADFIYWGAPNQYWGQDDLYWGAVYNVSDAAQRSNQGFSSFGKSSGFILTIQLSIKPEFTISRIYV